MTEEPLLMVAELLYFIQEEMASSLADVVFRRSRLGSAECPDSATLARIAECMGRELAWTGEEREQQIAKVLQDLAPLCEKGGK